MAMKDNFIPGLELSRQYYWKVIRPILDANYTNIKHTAALIGDGSEVLGFDTPLSTDHDWGPRIMLFLSEADYSNLSETVNQVIRKYLPESFLGYSIEPKNRTKKDHSVRILTIRDYIMEYLGFDIKNEFEPADWLTFPEQKLCAITKGDIFWDGVELNQVRNRFEYYPQDIWLYLLASGWTRIGQEEHLMGRAGNAGDEIGSALIASRLVRDLMRLCYLMEKQYAPYAKWFGIAFTHLAIAEELIPVFGKILTSSEWIERQKYLTLAYEIVAEKHNSIGITESLDINVNYFFERPFLVIGGERFAQAISAQIKDPKVKLLVNQRLIGSVDQFSDSTDILTETKWRMIIRKLYEL
jgi:hypothetical protein